MGDNLDRYLPEYDEEAERLRFSNLSKEQLLDLLITASRIARVMAKESDEQHKKIARIEAICSEPSKMAQAPGIPSAEDLKRKFEE